MELIEQIKEQVFGPFSGDGFNRLALRIFQYQYFNNPLYHEFARLNHRDPEHVKSLEHIPFLPVSFFRSHRVITGSQADTGQGVQFVSSGTTGSTPSVHYVLEPALYIESVMRGFKRVFGSPEEYHIFALLPSYLERGNASLVYMADQLIKASGSQTGGFYHTDYAALKKDLLRVADSDRKSILIGVTFALLEFAAILDHPMPDLLIVETGGMKGRGREMIREELHQHLSQGYGVEQVCSEYGMTELCSQAWSLGEGRYHPPPWMRVMIRDINDPYRIVGPEERGAVNIIDLANLHSCAFLATDDLGISYPDGSFEILGRIDGSQIRGCNLMMSL